MPNRYNFVAPSGIAIVATVKAARNTAAVACASSCRPRRHSRPAPNRATRQTNWPTVVSAWSWFDEGNAGHCTRPIATSAAAQSSTATMAATTMWPMVLPAPASAVLISDGKFAEDGPWDVAQHHHHVAERAGRPDQLLALR